MGRKYYYPRKNKYRSSGSGGLAAMIFSALAGRRSHGHYYRPRSSLKSSLVNALLRAVFRKFPLAVDRYRSETFSLQAC